MSRAAEDDVAERVAALEAMVQAIESQSDTWCSIFDTVDRRLRALEAATGVVVGVASRDTSARRGTPERRMERSR
jgi:hypothetical protein